MEDNFFIYFVADGENQYKCLLVYLHNYNH